MKKLYFLDDEEKKRILNLHESASKRQYLSEQPTPDFGQQTQSTEPVTEPVVGPTFMDSGAIIKQGDYGDPYVYAKLGDSYYFAKASEGDNPNWTLAKKQVSINDIKRKIFNEKIPVIKTKKPPVKNQTKVQKDDSQVVKKQTTNTDSFKSVDASDQVKKQLQYMKNNNILSNDKFTILDDKNSKVYEINPGYKIVKSFFVLTGKNKGDELKTKSITSWALDNWRTVLSKIYNSKGEAVKDIENAYFAQDEWRVKNTPSGIFKRAGIVTNWLNDLVATNLAEETYGKRFITWETLDGNIIPFGFHGTQKPERLPVINNTNSNQKISKRKMSFGCINFKESDVIEISKFIDRGQISIWLPDATNNIVQFPASYFSKDNTNRFDKYRMTNRYYMDPGKI